MNTTAAEAFVYLWYDSENKMFYLGKHRGSPDDSYTHSSTIWESFTKNNVPRGVSRRILAYGTHEEICILEHELLINRKKRCWDRYYNKSLGDPRYVDISGENHPNWQGGLTAKKAAQVYFDKVYGEVSRFPQYKDKEKQHLYCIEETKRLIAEGYEIRTKDVSPKAHRDLMARCWFSLSKNKRTVPIEHRSQDSWVKVSGSEKHGIATIWDYDILLFVIAQLMAAVNDGFPTGRRFQFTGYEYFKFIGRSYKIGGKAYTDIWKSLERLHHTFVETDIRMDDRKQNHTFNWLSEIKQIVEGNRHRGYEVIIPDWLYSSVVDNKMVLTIDDDYFSIKGGLERWLYMFGRKSTGHQVSSWTENTKSIYEKSGSLGSFREFKRKIKNIIEKDNLVGYEMQPVTIPAMQAYILF